MSTVSIQTLENEPSQPESIESASIKISEALATKNPSTEPLTIENLEMDNLEDSRKTEPKFGHITKSSYTASDPKMNEQEVITEQEESLEQPLQKKIIFSPRTRKNLGTRVSKKTRKRRKYHYKKQGRKCKKIINQYKKEKCRRKRSKKCRSLQKKRRTCRKIIKHKKAMAKRSRKMTKK